jgi:radical SAM superfamily enzyme YgiQ (UPF0313 family)
MPDVLLTLLPPWGRPTLPIGLGYLGQYLAAHGVQHEVLDLNLEIFREVENDPQLAELWRPQQAEAWVHPQRFEGTLAALEPRLQTAVDRLARSKAAIVGFSVNQSNARITIETARRLRARSPDRTIVLGGLGVYIPGERRLVPEGLVDLFVMGEGEATLLEVVRRVAAGEGLEEIAGTLRHPEQQRWEPRAPLELGAHWPTYDRFSVGRYPDGGQPMPLLLGRGCVCRCSFCGDYPFWGKYRSRRGEQVLAEIEHHVHQYGIRTFEFNDLAINGDLAALETLCDGIIARGLDLEWSSYAYFRPMPAHLPAKLRRAGCVMLRFGMESASNAVLERMRKPHRAPLAAEVLAAMTRADIHCNLGLMVGFPDETDAELEETCAFLRRHQAEIHEVDSLSVFYIKPLSEVEQHPERYGVRFPEDHTIRWNRWEGRDGSTHERRAARAWRLVEAIEGTSIRFQRCNIFGL